MSNALNWALAAHIIGIVFWLGGLLVAARILMVLGNSGPADAQKALVAVERRVLKGFVHPGAAITVLAGVALAAIDPAYLRQPWLHLKLILVLILIAVDLFLTIRFRSYEAGRAPIEPGQAKLLHASVALLLLLIVILAVVKPFS